MMPLSQGKKRRKLYRENVVRGQSRFDEMMENLIAGGTRRCESCRMPRPAQQFSGSTCKACCYKLKRIDAAAKAEERQSRREQRVLRPVGDGVVYVDASFRDGFAGLAMVGALGDHYRSIGADSSTQAEVMALGWAMSMARANRLHGLTFRTDCTAAFVVHEGAGAKAGWKVEQVPRAQNTHADRLAGLARKAQSESDWNQRSRDRSAHEPHQRKDTA